MSPAAVMATPTPFVYGSNSAATAYTASLMATLAGYSAAVNPVSSPAADRTAFAEQLVGEYRTQPIRSLVF
jgi:hypothetical protein